MRLLLAVLGTSMSPRQLRWSIRMVPFFRSTCLIISPSASEMRVPVSRQVSQISRFGSSSCASTCAVSSGERMRFSYTSHFFGSFTHFIGFAYERGMISHSVPGGADLLEPVHHVLGFQILEARVLPLRQDVAEGPGVLGPGAHRDQMLARRHLVYVIALPHLRERAKLELSGIGRRVLRVRLHRCLHRRRRLIQVGQELIALLARLCDRPCVLALARAKRLESPCRPHGAVRLDLILPVAEEPVVFASILPLMYFRMLYSRLQLAASSQQRPEVTFGGVHKASALTSTIYARRAPYNGIPKATRWQMCNSSKARVAPT